MSLNYSDLHIGRSWSGPGAMEEFCPCPKEPCGLVQVDRADLECDQHSPQAGKTIRTSHHKDDCVPLMPESPGPAPF